MGVINYFMLFLKSIFPEEEGAGSATLQQMEPEATARVADAQGRSRVQEGVERWEGLWFAR